MRTRTPKFSFASPALSVTTKRLTRGAVAERRRLQFAATNLLPADDPGAIRSRPKPGVRTQIDRDRCKYQFKACEENIWKLIERPEVQANIDNHYVIFMFNSYGRVIFWQENNTHPEGLQTWDYHVMLTSIGEHGASVYDFDTKLPFPTNLDTYIAKTFRDQTEVAERNRVIFRIIPAKEYYQRLHTHRVGWRRKLPPWPRMRSKDKGTRITVEMLNDYTAQAPGYSVDVDGLRSFFSSLTRSEYTQMLSRAITGLKQAGLPVDDAGQYIAGLAHHQPRLQRALIHRIGRSGAPSPSAPDRSQPTQIHDDVYGQWSMHDALDSMRRELVFPRAEAAAPVRMDNGQSIPDTIEDLETALRKTPPLATHPEVRLPQIDAEERSSLRIWLQTAEGNQLLAQALRQWNGRDRNILRLMARILELAPDRIDCSLSNALGCPLPSEATRPEVLPSLLRLVRAAGLSPDDLCIAIPRESSYWPRECPLKTVLSLRKAPPGTKKVFELFDQVRAHAISRDHDAQFRSRALRTALEAQPILTFDELFLPLATLRTLGGLEPIVIPKSERKAMLAILHQRWPIPLAALLASTAMRFDPLPQEWIQDQEARQIAKLAAYTASTFERIARPLLGSDRSECMEQVLLRIALHEGADLEGQWLKYGRIGPPVFAAAAVDMSTGSAQAEDQCIGFLKRKATEESLNFQNAWPRARRDWVDIVRRYADEYKTNSPGALEQLIARMRDLHTLTSADDFSTATKVLFSRILGSA